MTITHCFKSMDSITISEKVKLIIRILDIHQESGSLYKFQIHIDLEPKPWSKMSKIYLKSFLEFFSDVLYYITVETQSWIQGAPEYGKIDGLHFHDLIFPFSSSNCGLGPIFSLQWSALSMVSSLCFCICNPMYCNVPTIALKKSTFSGCSGLISRRKRHEAFLHNHS